MFIMAMTLHQWPFETPVNRLTLSQIVVLAHVRSEMNGPGTGRALSHSELAEFKLPGR